ncbi:MAG: alpha-L-fucosidase [Chloroflexota bacterium]|nr:alpha-L-fucosidase [Chloroflexota bacterium]
MIQTQHHEATWDSLDSRPIPPWFNQAKFGIFVHWGVYSVPAWRPVGKTLYASYAEWYYASVIDDLDNGGREFHKKNYGQDFEYRDFAPLFRAELFDPASWAELFRRSGARYVVLTAKHHDGFCLWPTKSPYKENWNSLATGPRRDLVGDLADAVRREGLRMGLYYSIIEWESNPTHRTESGYFLRRETIEKYGIPEDEYVDGHLLPQLKELVTAYQPSLIYADGGEWDGSEDHWKTREFLAWLYNQAANREEVVVNDRWAKDMPGKHGDYYSSEYGDTALVGPGHPWEESRGIGGSYGFNRAENIEDYSTARQLIHELVHVVSRGGNFLLNVGPTADGRIPLIMQQRLLEVGDWLRVNGEAIYGTKAWRRQKTSVDSNLASVLFTVKGEDLYAICTEWPQGDLIITGLKGNDQLSVSLLGVSKELSWETVDDRIVIAPPPVLPAETLCQHAYVFKAGGVLG